MLKEKLLEELNRYNAINKYAEKLIFEQAEPEPAVDPNAPAAAGEAPVPPPDPNASPEGAVPPADAEAGMGGDLGGGVTPPPAPAEGGETSTPPVETEPVATPEDTTEELDITDLVNMTKNIKQSIEQKTDDNVAVNQKMDNIFTKLGDLENRLGEMDRLISKIDELGSKVEQMKPPTPEEKLEMRSLDSYPFNQNPTQFFNQKKNEMRASGKNEYVLTKDDVKNYSQSEIRNSFNPNNPDYNAVKY